MSVNLGGIAILNIKDSDYRCIISLITINEVIKLLQTAEPKKVEHFKLKKYTNFWKH